MAERPPVASQAARPPLWFLADREAFLQRFVLRTLLRPPRFRRGPRPRAFDR
jgi:hypothetical protein